MGDLSTVRGYIPQLEADNIDVLLLNIHESPGQELLARFGFEFTPTYLMYSTEGEEIFRSNSLPSFGN
mgnify:CR=1 FL=1